MLSQVQGERLGAERPYTCAAGPSEPLGGPTMVEASVALPRGVASQLLSLPAVLSSLHQEQQVV